ncbi:sugar transporter [Acetobacter malorum]|uniref:Sugar transporter n=2 Tax=Acetobacter malorum TaxID=178901 RepID=A0A087PQW6_9PROT|nr:MFS transporter [Acetobacter malorum]KFL89769.1 putative transport transmembrane protein [Acetobacter malorum]KXV06313.1 sugar transporter [Acetobacter malorum]KXV14718.1 sugar transporter [Acetobacter malorum]KXV70430.1 sugar transporter [Acetobacter malorum]GBQ77029.1 arabinose transmembrane efflux protein [Acetobacter malorum DSM 14337]
MTSETVPPESGLTVVPPPHGRTAALLTLTFGTFVVGTGEFAIMGMLPEFAQSLNLSLADAGYAITAYALGVVIGAPLITILGARLSRRELLLVLLIMFCLGNFLSIVMPTPGLVEVARFLTGLPHGALFGISALVAASMVERSRRGWAVGRVLSGIAISTLIGAPFSTFAADHFGWRIAYLIIGLFGVLTFLGVLRYIPADKPNRKNSPLKEITALGNTQVLLTLLTAAVGFGGMFGVYTYLTSVLQNVTHVPEWQTMVYMVIWGAGMLVGANAGAWLVDRNINLAAIIALAGSAVIMFTFSTVLHSNIALMLIVFLIPTFVNGLGPALQTRLMDFAGEAQTLAASLNHSAFNIANALGASLGSVLLAHQFGYGSLGIGGALLSIGGLLVYLFALLLLKKSGQQEERGSLT